MAQYIEKAALVAEINKRIIDAPVNNIGHQRVWAYNDVKDILDTLEVKEVQEEPVSEKPKYKGGDILYKINDGSKIEIIDIVADQYKFECSDEFPHYEFFEYIETNYMMLKDESK